MTPYTRRKRTLKARVRRQKTEENVVALCDHVCLHGNDPSLPACRPSWKARRKSMLHKTVNSLREQDNIRWLKPVVGAKAPS
jgi:hypothetical protein